MSVDVTKMPKLGFGLMRLPRIHHLRMRRSGTDRTDTRCSGDRLSAVRKRRGSVSKI